MSGFGNKTAADPTDMQEHQDTRYGKHTDTAPYSDATEHGSGTTGGVGFGNKTAPSGDIDSSDTKFGSHLDTAPYSGATEHGSGSTGGAGFGNKTGSFAQGSSWQSLSNEC
jgi:hypothetical protein